MKIKVNLSTKSIKSAIKQLENAKKKLPIMVNEFLQRSCQEIVNMANRNLEFWDIGNKVKDNIRNSWAIDILNNRAIISNTCEKSVYVEFGTGVVGEQSPHPNAENADYEYNVESEYKDEKGRWTFYQNLQDLDLPTEYSDDRIYFNEPNRNSERMLVRTSGAPASMFVYNAIVDFTNNQKAKQIWQEIKGKYWG